MSLKESIEKDRQALEEALKREAEEAEKALKAEENTQDNDEEPDTDTVEDTVDKEESTKETEKEAEKPPKKEETAETRDNAAFARMRREKDAAERKARDLEDRISRLESRKSDEGKEVEEKKVDPIVQELDAVIKDKRMRDAEAEFVALESDFRQSNPDYDDISLQYKTALFNAERLSNPRATHNELLRATNTKLLMKAANYAAKGLNPIEEMYDEAVTLGFKKSEQKAEEKEVPTEKKKPDPEKVASNKARSSGMAAAKAAGAGGQMTSRSAAGLTNEEWMKLPRDEKARLLKQIA